jgi:hypothetical protein
MVLVLTDACLHAETLTHCLLDMELRAKEYHRPHVEGTVSDLISGINNPDEIRCILDCNIYEGLPPDLA